MQSSIEKKHNTKILILEGFNLKANNWRNSLKENLDYNIIGVVNYVNDALYLMEIYAPDVIILDLSCMTLNAIETIYKIKEACGNTKMIILSKGDDKNEIMASLTVGVGAFCLTDISMTSLSLIIKTVAKGACWFDPVAVPTLLSSLPKPKKEKDDLSLVAPLSEREHEVLKLLVAGKSNTLIAKELIVSVHTAKAHVCNILHKMQVTDRVQAAVKAFKLGLV